MTLQYRSWMITLLILIPLLLSMLFLFAIEFAIQWRIFDLAWRWPAIFFFLFSAVISISALLWFLWIQLTELKQYFVQNDPLVSLDKRQEHLIRQDPHRPLARYTPLYQEQGQPFYPSVTHRNGRVNGNHGRGEHQIRENG